MPVPTEAIILPDIPLCELFVSRMIEPLEPEDDVPVENSNDPLTPVVPASFVAIRILPDDVG